MIVGKRKYTASGLFFGKLRTVASKLTFRTLLSCSGLACISGFAPLLCTGIAFHETALFENRPKFFFIYFFESSRYTMNHGSKLSVQASAFSFYRYGKSTECIGGPERLLVHFFEHFTREIIFNRPAIY